MMKLTAATAATLLLAGGFALGATQLPDLTASRSEVASAVASSCSQSQAGCLTSIRAWVAAASACSAEQGETENCVCTREVLDIARGLGDAALYIKSTDAGLFGLVTSAVNDGAPGCFSGAFAQIVLPVAEEDGRVGTPG